VKQVTFSQLITKFMEAPAKINAAVAPALRVSAVEVQKTAQAKFGEYQPEVGEFPAWELLTLDTLHQKMDLAGGGADPLIGHYPAGQKKETYPVALRQSIAIQIDEANMSAAVGTNDPVGEWQEFGTDRGIPPRPFLRPALYENGDFIKKALSDALGIALFST
jgi:hypothetical protein